MTTPLQLTRNAYGNLQHGNFEVRIGGALADNPVALSYVVDDQDRIILPFVAKQLDRLNKVYGPISQNNVFELRDLASRGELKKPEDAGKIMFVLSHVKTDLVERSIGSSVDTSLAMLVVNVAGEHYFLSFRTPVLPAARLDAPFPTAGDVRKESGEYVIHFGHDVLNAAVKDVGFNKKMDFFGRLNVPSVIATQSEVLNFNIFSQDATLEEFKTLFTNVSALKFLGMRQAVLMSFSDAAMELKLGTLGAETLIPLQAAATQIILRHNDAVERAYDSLEIGRLHTAPSPLSPGVRQFAKLSR